MKREVAATLGELERKLRELQSELTAVSQAEAVSESQPEPQAQWATSARLIDEREPVAPPQPESSRPESPRPQAEALPREALSIDLVELVRFKEKLEGTLSELIEEYGKILTPRSSSSLLDEPSSRD